MNAETFTPTNAETSGNVEVVEKDINAERQKSREEMLNAFRAAGLPLDGTLEAMVSESSEHRGGRRGSGFTQATRRIADFVRQVRSDKDLRILSDDVSSDFEDRAYDEIKDADLTTVNLSKYLDREALRSVEEQMTTEECKMLSRMIVDLLDPKSNMPNVLRGVDGKLSIGTCTTAELYFFDYFEGRGNFRHAKMNLIVDEAGEPLMIEKIGAGENHSAVTLKETVINGVRLPAGSLMGVLYDEATPKVDLDQKGSVIKAADCKGFEFLRLTTLAINPTDRERAFSAHYQYQKDNEMPGFDTLRLEDVLVQQKERLSHSRVTG